jgi:outer membrane lipoprotein-sorting protein
MAGSQGLLVGVLLLGTAALTSVAAAETVPLPTPAPLPKEGAAPPAARPSANEQSGLGGIAAGLKSLFHLDKQPEAPAAPAPTTAIALNPTQRTQIDKVSTYLSGVQQLVGNFVQVGPDGSRVKGEFYIQKPGKVRFEYDPPSPIAMISDGSSLAVRDTKLATQDIYPLSQTPLRYLLSDRIDLMKDTNVVSVTMDDLYISVTIEEKQALIGTSRLMLMLGVKDGQLKQWTVTDPQGYDTTVAIYNLNTTAKPDPSLFKIDFTHYPTTSNN